MTGLDAALPARCDAPYQSPSCTAPQPTRSAHAGARWPHARVRAAERGDRDVDRAIAGEGVVDDREAAATAIAVEVRERLRLGSPGLARQPMPAPICTFGIERFVDSSKPPCVGTNAAAVKCQAAAIDIDPRAVESALVERPLEVADQSRIEPFSRQTIDAGLIRRSWARIAPSEVDPPRGERHAADRRAIGADRAT